MTQQKRSEDKMEIRSINNDLGVIIIIVLSVIFEFQAIIFHASSQKKFE